MSNPIDLCTLADVRNYLNCQPAGVAQAFPVLPGTGYTVVTVTATSVDGNGSGATFAGVLSAGALIGVTIVTPGTGYTQPPNLTVGGNGTGATAICYLVEDYKLSRLITNASQMFLSRAGRESFGSKTITERRNGNAQAAMCPYWWPILSVTSVVVSGFTVPPSPNGTQAGWINDQYKIYFIGGSAFPQSPALTPYAFWKGFQNILLTYTYGWASVPFDINQAVIELVAQKYKRAQHVDQSSQALPQGGGTATFSQKDMPAEVMATINNYRIKGIIE